MENRVVELSKYRIDKAQKDLESAEILLNKKLYAQSINRSYYPIFHSVRALLAFERFDSRKHSGIISYFNKNFIKTNLIKVKYSEILMKAEKIRTECDYDDFYMVDESSAQAQFDNAKSFLLRIKNYIEINRLIQ